MAFRHAALASIMATGLAHAALAPAALAQDWPAKQPIKVIVPFTAGSTTDIVGRTVYDQVSRQLGQSIVFENRGGAGTTIGTHLVAKSPPDGYTLMFTSVSYTTNAAVQPKLPFDPVTDLTGITMIGRAPMLLVVHPGVPARTAKELLALARARPGTINYASNGIGTIPHLLVEILVRDAKLDLVHVPYKGLGIALTDLVAGQVHMLIASPPSVYPQVKAGKLRAIAVSTEQRSSFVPDLPTIAESGVPGYVAQQWWGMFAPAATPRGIVDRLHLEIEKVLAGEDIRRRLSAEGAEPAPMAPAAFTALVKKEIGMWSRVVKERGIRAE